MMLLQPIWIASGLSNKQWSTRVKPASSNGTINRCRFNRHYLSRVEQSAEVKLCEVSVQRRDDSKVSVQPDTTASASRIARVTHSSLAAPWWQGVRRWSSEGCRLLTLVNFFAVTNSENQDHQSIFFYAGNDSDVTQSVFPEVTKY